MYVYIWEYEVREGADVEFRRHYGPHGTWVTLFRQAPGYVATQLLQDRETPRRYVTIDTWESAGAHAAFRRRFSREFEELDTRCEALTLRQVQVGTFDVR